MRMIFVVPLIFLGFLSLQDAQFKFLEFPLVGLLRPSCFPGKVVEGKLFFKVMAGTALRRIPEHFPLVKQGLLFNVAGRLKSRWI